MKPRTGRESGVETEQSDRQGEKTEVEPGVQTVQSDRQGEKDRGANRHANRERESVCMSVYARERETGQAAKRRRCTGVTDPERRSDDETLDGVVSEREREVALKF